MSTTGHAACPPPQAPAAVPFASTPDRHRTRSRDPAGLLCALPAWGDRPQTRLPRLRRRAYRMETRGPGPMVVDGVRCGDAEIPRWMRTSTLLPGWSGLRRRASTSVSSSTTRGRHNLLASRPTPSATRCWMPTRKTIAIEFEGFLVPRAHGPRSTSLDPETLWRPFWNACAHASPELCNSSASRAPSVRAVVPVGWGRHLTAECVLRRGRSFGTHQQRLPNGRYYIRTEVNPGGSILEVTTANDTRDDRLFVRLRGRPWTTGATSCRRGTASTPSTTCRLLRVGHEPRRSCPTPPGARRSSSRSPRAARGTRNGANLLVPAPARRARTTHPSGSARTPGAGAGASS